VLFHVFLSRKQNYPTGFFFLSPRHKVSDNLSDIMFHTTGSALTRRLTMTAWLHTNWDCDTKRRWCSGTAGKKQTADHVVCFRWGMFVYVVSLIAIGKKATLMWRNARTHQGLTHVVSVGGPGRHVCGGRGGLRPNVSTKPCVKGHPGWRHDPSGLQRGGLCNMDFATISFCLRNLFLSRDAFFLNKGLFLICLNE